MPLHLRRLAGALATAALAWGLAAPSTFAVGTLDHAAVIAAIPGVVAAGAPSFLMHGVDEFGDWQAAAGVADIATGAPASPDAAFRIGSISKMFVSVAVLQLVHEGRIGLDTPVDAYLPGLLARGDVITIRELLQHRSGLATTGFGNGRGATYLGDINRDCRDDVDPVAEVRAADVQLFEPGTSFSYSNEGYTALGLVIEHVTGQPYQQVLTDRIITPLGLTHTSFQEGVPVWPTPYVHGYDNVLPGINWKKRLVDATDCKTSVFSAAGSGISTTRDLTTFLRALMHGQLLPDDLYQQMIDGQPTDFGPGILYGLGVIRETGVCGTDLIGHGGSVFGYQSNVYATLDGTRTVAESFALYPGPDSMWSAIGAVNRAEFCGAAAP